MMINRLSRLMAGLVLALMPVALHADAVEQHVKRGIEQLYNVDFDGASASFDRAIAADPNDPTGYFFRANVHLWSYLFDQRKEQLGEYLTYSDRTITVAEKRISANPRDSRARLFLGMTYGYRAIAHAREENITAAAISAKTCYDRLSEAKRNDPKLYDANLGLGLFHFLFGSVPKAAQLMAGLTGIKGDAKLGIREIEAAANHGTYFRNDARLIMALLKVYHQGDLSSGVTTLSKLTETYPKNVALLYALGAVYLDRGELNKAIGYFDRVARLGNRDFRAFTNMSYGRLGTAYFKKNDFTRAKGYLQSFLKASEDREFRNYSWYLLGLCYEIGGNRDFAVKSYERATSGPSGSPEDRQAKRRAKELKTKPLTPLDITIIKALNNVDAGAGDAVIAAVSPLLGAKGNTPVQQAKMQFALARAYQLNGKYNEAIGAFNDAIRVRNHTESWISPFSYFHMSECYQQMGDRKRSRESLDRASAFHDYDNEHLLRFKIERDVTMID